MRIEINLIPWGARLQPLTVDWAASPLARRAGDGGHDVREDEPVALNDFADLDGNWLLKHRPLKGVSVELAVLAARVNAAGKLAEQLGVEGPAGKRALEFLGVHASNQGAQARRHHLPRESQRVKPPDGKKRCDARRGELFFAILPDVFEEQVAEDDVSDALLARPANRLRHRLFVNGVRAG